MTYALSGKIARLGYIPAGYSGLRGFGYIPAGYSGLGDYASDHAAWLQEQAAYSAAYQNWQNQVAMAAQQNANNQAAYTADLARWNAEQAAYNAALSSYNNQSRMSSMAYGMSLNSTLAQYPSIVIPPGFSGCVTQAQHNAWQQTCSALQSVKGLGAAVPTGPECGLALLPVCLPPVPAPAPLRPKPTPPSSITVSPAPPSIRPEPQPPPPAVVPTPTPLSIPTPQPSTPSVTQNPYSSTVPLTPATTPAPTKSAGLLSNGLLLIVLAGSSYALYRTLKKPKAAA